MMQQVWIAPCFPLIFKNSIHLFYDSFLVHILWNICTFWGKVMAGRKIDLNFTWQGLDGIVERDGEGIEMRYPVILTAKEKLIARKVNLAFKVCLYAVHSYDNFTELQLILFAASSVWVWPTESQWEELCVRCEWIQLCEEIRKVLRWLCPDFAVRHHAGFCTMYLATVSYMVLLHWCTCVWGDFAVQQGSLLRALPVSGDCKLQVVIGRRIMGINLWPPQFGLLSLVIISSSASDSGGVL